MVFLQYDIALRALSCVVVSPEHIKNLTFTSGESCNIQSRHESLSHCTNITPGGYLQMIFHPEYFI